MRACLVHVEALITLTQQIKLSNKLSYCFADTQQALPASSPLGSPVWSSEVPLCCSSSSVLLLLHPLTTLSLLLQTLVVIWAHNLLDLFQLVLYKCDDVLLQQLEQNIMNDPIRLKLWSQTSDLCWKHWQPTILQRAAWRVNRIDLK